MGGYLPAMCTRHPSSSGCIWCNAVLFRLPCSCGTHRAECPRHTSAIMTILSDVLTGRRRRVSASGYMRLHGQAREALRGCPERRPSVSGRPWALYAASGGHPSPESQGRRALHRPQKHKPSRVGAGARELCTKHQWSPGKLCRAAACCGMRQAVGRLWLGRLS